VGAPGQAGPAAAAVNPAAALAGTPQPAPAGSGLERRQPGASLAGIEGGQVARTGNGAKERAAPGRSADEVRTMLARYRSGVTAGRDQRRTPVEGGDE
jgi:hypothetical protein